MWNEDSDRSSLHSDRASTLSDARSCLSVVDNLCDDFDEDLQGQKDSGDADDEMGNGDSRFSLNLTNIPLQDASEAEFRPEEQSFRGPVPQCSVEEIQKKLADIGSFDGRVQQGKFTKNVTNAGQEEPMNPSPDEAATDHASEAVFRDKQPSVRSPDHHQELTEMQKKLRSYDRVACVIVPARPITVPNLNKMKEKKKNEQTSVNSPDHHQELTDKQKKQRGYDPVACVIVPARPRTVPLPNLKKRKVKEKNKPKKTGETENRSAQSDRFPSKSERKMVENERKKTMERPKTVDGRMPDKFTKNVTNAGQEEPKNTSSDEVATEHSFDAVFRNKQPSVYRPVPQQKITEMQKKLRSYDRVACMIVPARPCTVPLPNLKERKDKEKNKQPSVSSPDHHQELTDMRKKLRSYDPVVCVIVPARPRTVPLPYLKKKKENVKNKPRKTGETENRSAQSDRFPSKSERKMVENQRKKTMERPKTVDFNPRPFGKGMSAGHLVLRLHRMKNPIPHAVDEAPEEVERAMDTDSDETYSSPHARSIMKRERKDSESSSDDCGPSPQKRPKRKSRPSKEGIKTGLEVDSCAEGLLKLAKKLEQKQVAAADDDVICLDDDDDVICLDDDVADLDDDVICLDDDVADLDAGIKKKININKISNSSDENAGTSPDKLAPSSDTNDSTNPNKIEKKVRKRGPPRVRNPKVLTKKIMSQVNWIFETVMESSPEGPEDGGDVFFCQVFGLFRDIWVDEQDLRSSFQEAQKISIGMTMSYFPGWIPRPQRKKVAEQAEEADDDEEQEESYDNPSYADGVDGNVEEFDRILEEEEVPEPVGEDVIIEEEVSVEVEDDSEDPSTDVYEFIEDDESLEVLESSTDRETTLFEENEKQSETSISSESSPVKEAKETPLKEGDIMTQEKLQKIFCECAFNYAKFVREKYLRKISQIEAEGMLEERWTDDVDGILEKDKEVEPDE